MAEFFAMGGYGVYIWACYGLAAVVMIGLLVASLRTMRLNEATVAAIKGAKRPRPRTRDSAAANAANGADEAMKQAEQD